MTHELVRAGDFNVTAWAQERPIDNPVDEYINGLKRATSKSTMLQALGVMASVYEGDGRPESDKALPPAQRKVIAEQQKEYARNYDWFAVDDRATLAMLADLKSFGYAKASQAKMLAAVSGVLGKCMRIIHRHDRGTRQRLVAQWQGTREELAGALQMMDAISGMRYGATQSAIDEIADYVKKGIEEPERSVGKHKEEGRALKESEVKKLFNACAKQGGALGARNQVILALGIGCGLRRSEIAKLQYEHVDWEGLTLGDDPYLPIRILDAKGNKNRDISASNGTRQSLLLWRALRGDAPGPLLYSFDRWTGMQAGQGITGQVVYDVLGELSDIAGLAYRPAPHDLRRTFVTGFIRNTKDISMASKLAGHKSVETTMRYDKRDKEELAQAVIEAVHAPFNVIVAQAPLAEAAA